MDKKLFVIPIYLIDSEEEDSRERLGMDEDAPLNVKQSTLYTIYISSYWIDPNENKHTKTVDIVFYVDGVSYRTPYTEQIINEVIRPAMHVRASLTEEQPNFITGSN